MSTDREVTRIVRSWLEEGVNALPDRVLDNVLDQVPATRQRRAWWPAWRLPYMNTQIRIVLAAAAVVIVAVIGINLVPRTGGVGGSSSPTPIPSPAPTLPASGVLAPGTYRSVFSGSSPTAYLTFTVASGWSAFDGWAVLRNNSNPPNGMGSNGWQIGGVYPDPCHWQTKAAASVSPTASSGGTTVVPVGPTVADLVAALVAQKRGSTVVAPVDVTIDGFSGKQIDLMVPLNVNFAACNGGAYHTWTDQGMSGSDRFNQGPGQHDLLDILDVNGRTLVINRTFYAANTAADLAELQAIVDSVKITP